MKNKLDDSLIDKLATLLNVYRLMISRCYDPADSNYPRYGGKGVTVCEEWRNSRAAFINWALYEAEEKHEIGLQCDRIDNNGSYTPDNCRFVTRKVNCNNRSNNRRLTVNNVTKTVTEWSREINVGQGTLSGWLRKEGEQYAIDRIKQYLIKRPSQERKVIQFDLEGNQLRSFDTVTAAAKYIASTSGMVSRVASGMRSQTKGFKFKYA